MMNLNFTDEEQIDDGVIWTFRKIMLVVTGQESYSSSRVRKLYFSEQDEAEKDYEWEYGKYFFDYDKLFELVWEFLCENERKSEIVNLYGYHNSLTINYTTINTYEDEDNLRIGSKPTDYDSFNFLESFETIGEDNIYKKALEKYLHTDKYDLKKMFFRYGQIMPPSYQTFCTQIAGDFEKNFISLIEKEVLRPKQRLWGDQFINPEFLSVQIDEKNKLEFDVKFDTCEQYITHNNKNLIITDEEYYSTDSHSEYLYQDRALSLETKYIINNVKIKDFSKKELTKFLESKGFPYEKSYKEYIRFLNTMRFMLGDKNFVATNGYERYFDRLLDIFLPSKIKSRDFINHTHIVGRSGSGKSELLKTIIRDLRSRCILIDPHGDIADSLDKKCNFFKIAPMENRFVINPFDIQDKGIDNRELVAEEIIQLLQEIIQDSNVSVLMKTISFPIISTLLKLPYADFRMFADCINPISGIEHLERLTPLVDDHLKHIWEDLKTDTYDTTKRSIFNRLQSFLNKHKIVSSVCGYDDFGSAIKRVEQGENLVISLPIPQLGEDVSEVLGRFFMCRMQIWAKRRQTLAEKDRKPVVLIVDECQNFLSDETARTLDQFGRKFGLYMILAHQHIAQIDGKGLKGSILANCKNKIVGYCDDSTISTMSKAMGVAPGEFKNLKKGHFWGLFENKEPLKFYARLARYRDYEDEVIYADSKNKEFLNGWDLVGETMQITTKNTQKTPKFTAKFDL